MKTIIIAEAGVNHNGSIELAKRLIDAAAKAGVDYVKFQTFKTDRLVSRKAMKASYQIKNMSSEKDTAQYEMLKRLELTFSAFKSLKAYCEKKRTQFLSTGFDLDSLTLLNKLAIDFFKVPSGEITNLPYLQRIASFRKPVVLSTGMCSMTEIEQAIDVLINSGISREWITVLHCNTEYPTPFEDVNLKAMASIRHAFHVKVGYSDHTEGIIIPIAAVAAGATVIEKHFTLDRGMEGPDHKASIEPDELCDMVQAIRIVEKAQGDGIKKASTSEVKNIVVARKSIHLGKDLKRGSIIRLQDLEMLRPGDGISPMEIEKVVGKQIARNGRKGEKLSFSDLKN